MVTKYQVINLSKFCDRCCFDFYPLVEVAERVLGLDAWKNFPYSHNVGDEMSETYEEVRAQLLTELLGRGIERQTILESFSLLKINLS